MFSVSVWLLLSSLLLLSCCCHRFISPKIFFPQKFSLTLTKKSTAKITLLLKDLSLVVGAEKLASLLLLLLPTNTTLW